MTGAVFAITSRIAAAMLNASVRSSVFPRRVARPSPHLGQCAVPPVGSGGMGWIRSQPGHATVASRSRMSFPHLQAPLRYGSAAKVYHHLAHRQWPDVQTL